MPAISDPAPLLEDRTRLHSDPVRNFKYQVQLFHPETGFNDEFAKIGFMSVEGLAMNTEMVPYREGGWTVRALAYHVPDSHMNAYISCKLALTEDTPTIKTYDEAAWARLKDSELTPVEVSLMLLECIHTRWVTLLRSLGEQDFQRQLKHPELGAMSVDGLVALYDWHGNHHLAHVTALRERMKW